MDAQLWTPYLERGKDRTILKQQFSTPLLQPYEISPLHNIRTNERARKYQHVLCLTLGVGISIV